MSEWPDATKRGFTVEDTAVKTTHAETDMVVPAATIAVCAAAGRLTRPEPPSSSTAPASFVVTLVAPSVTPVDEYVASCGVAAESTAFVPPVSLRR